MADTIIENLITRFGFDFDQKTLDKIDVGIENAVKNLTKMVVAAGAVGAAIFLFTKKIAESNDKLGKFSEEIGVDVEALQELGFAAELNGASIDSMNSSLASLSRLASEAARGVGAGVEAFGILGLSVTDAEGRLKNADDLLFDVSDAIAKLGTQAEKLELAGKLGIDSSLLLTIQKGSDALRRQREEARELGFIFDQNAAKAAADFNDEMLRATRVVTGLGNAIGQRLMKQITPMLKAFVAWFKANKELIKQNLVMFLDKTTKALNFLFNLGVRVGRVIEGLTQIFGGLKNTLLALGTAFLLLNAKALILPIILAAASVAVFLLIEDLVIFAKKGDSVFGKFEKRLNKIKELGRRENFWRDFFADPSGVLKQAWEDIKFLQKANWSNIADDTFAVILRITRFFEDAWVDSINFVKKQFDILPSLRDLTFGLLGGSDFGEKGPVFGEERGGSFLDRGQKETFAVAPKGGFPGQTTNNATTDSRTVNISVNGGDLEEVKRTIEGVLTDKFSTAKGNLKSQVVY